MTAKSRKCESCGRGIQSGSRRSQCRACTENQATAAQTREARRLNHVAALWFGPVSRPLGVRL